MRSLRCEAKHEQMVRRFGETPFQTMREFLCFAATLGFSVGNTRAVGRDTIDIVDGRIFSSHAPALDVMYSVGIADSGDLELLLEEKEDELVGCFESYATAGLDYIERILQENPGDVSGTESMILSIIADFAPTDDAGSNIDPHNVEF